MTPGSISNSIKLKVRFHECDPMKIVWHGNYYKYFEEAREKFVRQHGLSYLNVEEKGFYTPIVKTECEYLAPLKYGDEFEVFVTYERTRAAKLIFHYEIKFEDKVICKAKTIQVFTDMSNKLVLYPPEFLQEWRKKMDL
ncbi:thioesterase family protein [Gramella sp. AN32]|uniref:Thioesterase family protein n=1 Tax=Christiangramia antarctica TaxID=2058158 RepID=A0ABW5WXX7_9FLAO|nr:thioesterase family protein [Gramella sp. AN32]MCM4156757.1 4-hydroxybenzoyl-CoA thioesterase [Gramella sp. AN32]